MTTTTTPAATLAARLISEPTMPRRTDDGESVSINHLVVVTDPELGDVSVRWRIPGNVHAWVWRCTACHTRTRTPDCEHTFAAALTLAATLLGLNAVGVATTPTEGIPSP